MFTEKELKFLASQRLCRLATADALGRLHVIPVAFEINDELGTVDITGYPDVMRRSKKWRDVEATGEAALVVDDLASVDPWSPRGIEVRGSAVTADADTDAPKIRVTPRRIIGWGIDGDRYDPPNARNL
ncbi:PPOX class F420-dependent oxidoreductase [Saccharothrix australiensis]|uniref:Pyridoxamine 5'-phosphate oxidase family protein n=1 Tax=Saccharothrix australiensis TaxID=2072 RepID=A0A495W3F1_9PSEU|nr:PPOX class F420-dependent oxidoreductase [Saccharothrix australiensis]RKT55620.1 pyridoxamine 5'-phosphate oxidase family protein [Saccharothrix australiensis]